ncbi:MAG: 16S rRNA (guanine(966)-N(2))-methyltransferase RsmD [Actinomycetaceae bacterium]|nr:16S rRNA (guanine(966)-N(2))-methyltransferase RsmD [Actinomycetaceae bacterium]
MTRIVSGTHGGRTLQVPERGTRPTSERVREALFSRLESWDEIQGARVIDLFAGSGALGLEAMSRGASRCVLVDSAPAAIKVLKQNVSKNKFENVDVLRADAAKFSSIHDFTLAFLDPPYDIDPAQLIQVLEHLANFLADDALVVLELSSRTAQPQWPAGYILESDRKWGETRVWFLTFAPETGSVKP